MLETRIELETGTSVITTTLHTEPHTYYETGDYFITREGHVSEFEQYRRTSEEWKAQDNHKKLVAIIREIQRMTL